MKATLNRKAFVSALSACGCAIGKKTTIPILAYVKILIEKHENWNTCTISNTDLDVWIDNTVPVLAFSGDTIEICVLPSIMQKFLASSKAENVDLEYMAGVPESDEIPCIPGKLKLAAGGSISLGTMPTENFPVLPEFGGETYPVINLLETNSKAWIEMTSKVCYAVSDEENRFTLPGFLLEVSDKVRMVATDGHRLAILERGLLPSGNKPDSLIPMRVYKHLKKILGKSDIPMTVMRTKHVTADYLIVVAGDLILVSRLLTGNFPEYKRVLTNYDMKPAVADASKLIDGIDGVRHCADDKSHVIKIEFNSTSARFVAESPEKGKAELDVECLTGGTHGVTVGFCYDYVLDFLRSLPVNDVVHIRCGKKAEKAGVGAWEFKSQADPGLTGIIMPMRLA